MSTDGERTTFYNFSGGMESAAMLVVDRERIRDTKAIVRFADTGKHFPEMTESIRQIESILGISIVTVPRRITFDEYLFERGGMLRKGMNDCSRRMKRSNLTRHMKTFSRPYEVNLGFNSGEVERQDDFVARNERPWLHWRFPLIEADVSREDTWGICREAGFTILVEVYERMGRFDCFWCPNQKPEQAKKVPIYYPKLAAEWIEAEARKGHHFLSAGPLRVLVEQSCANERERERERETACSCFGGTASVADEIEAEEKEGGGTPQMIIDRFTGDYQFLSNFYPCPVVVAGRAYKSSEHAYQAHKAITEEERLHVASAPTAAEAKHRGRRVKIRPDWDRIKLDVMWECTWWKFQNPDLRDKLIATGDAEIVEENGWGDRYWGKVDGVGENHLGDLLMALRDELRRRQVVDRAEAQVSEAEARGVSESLVKSLEDRATALRTEIGEDLGAVPDRRALTDFPVEETPVPDPVQDTIEESFLAPLPAGMVDTPAVRRALQLHDVIEVRAVTRSEFLQNLKEEYFALRGLYPDEVTPAPLVRVAHSIEDVEALGGYPLLYADPNWLYHHAGGRGAAANHYETSPVEEIARLPVARIAAKNAVLFLWTTWPILLQDDHESGLDPVRQVVRAWGFRLKTIGFVWVKANKKSGTPFWGGGSWTRANTEVCLIATRGNIRRIDEGLDTPAGRAARSVHQLIETWEESVPDLVLRAPHPDVPDGVSRHSAKPAEVRDRIVQLVGDLPRIELYAQQRVEGWDAFGDNSALGGSDVALVVP